MRDPAKWWFGNQIKIPGKWIALEVVAFALPSLYQAARALQIITWEFDLFVAPLPFILAQLEKKWNLIPYD